MSKKSLSWILIVITIGNFLSFVFGLLNVTIFWVILAGLGLCTYKLLPKY